MSFQSFGFTQTVDAGADLSSSFQRFITLNTSGKAVLPSAGAFAIGVTLDKAVSGAACPFQQLGIAQVIIGTGGLTPKDKVATDASGGAVTAATGNVILGVCVVGGSAGDVASVLLTPNLQAVLP